MADKTEKPAKKSAQTVRERSQNDAQGPKTRRVRKTASSIAKPVAVAGKGVKAAAKPLSPLARPLKTRPARFTGRWASKLLLINYLRSSWRELRQVKWPGRKETAKLTLAVFAFAIVFGAIIAITDYGLDKIFHKVLL
jgi:preprotein translocase SecE subunit